MSRAKYYVTPLPIRAVQGFLYSDSGPVEQRLIEMPCCGNGEVELNAHPKHGVECRAECALPRERPTTRLDRTYSYEFGRQCLAKTHPSVISPKTGATCDASGQGTPGSSCVARVMASGTGRPNRGPIRL